MRKKGFVIITLVIVVVLLLVEIFIVRKVSQYEAKVEVCYATEYIEENTLITDEMIEVREIHLSYVHNLSIRNPKDILGQYAANNIEKDEMILSTDLTNKSSLRGKVLSPDNRLITVNFNVGQANGWWLKPGQCVDIIFIPNERTENTQMESKIKRFNNVRIAALIDENGNFVDRDVEMGIPKYVSFEVEKGLDEMLIYAKNNGTVEISVIPQN